MYQKIAKFSTLSTGVKLNHEWKFYSIFLFLLQFRNSTMPNNNVSTNNLSFSTKFYVFLKCTKKLRNSPLSEPEWTSITNGSFLRFFLFLLPFRNSIMPNNNVFKKLNNLSFSTKFYVFFWRLQCTKKLRNSPLCEPEWTSITNGSFLRFFLFLLPFRNSIMPNNNFQKTQ